MIINLMRFTGIKKQNDYEPFDNISPKSQPEGTIHSFHDWSGK